MIPKSPKTCPVVRSVFATTTPMQTPLPQLLTILMWFTGLAAIVLRSGVPSCRYHLLNPKYIYGRIKELQRAYRLRVLLCHVDTEDAVDPLAQVTKAALLNDCTLFCAWSPLVRLSDLQTTHCLLVPM